MIPAPFAYMAPDSLDQAVALLAENKGAKVLAGGHNLLTEMKLRNVSPPLVVDLRKIKSLQGIRGNANDGVQIGVLATLNQIVGDPTIKSSYQALAEAAAGAGDIQIRNAATLGGSLGYSELGADLVAALVALGASVHLTSSTGSKTLPYEDFLAQEAGSSNGANGAVQLMTAIELPPTTSGTKSGYEKFAKFATNAAICGVAVKVILAQDGTVSSCRIAATDGVTSAVRLPGVESRITGQRLTKETVVAAVVHAAENAAFPGDRFASGEYRVFLAQVLSGRALMRLAGLQNEVWSLEGIQTQTSTSREVKARLVPVSGGGNLATLELHSGGARIGRDAAVASIVINDRRVSRYHCRISEEGNGVFSIWDEGSTSGTYVNNEQVTMSGRTLQAGDLINFGPLQYRFEPAGSSQLGTGDATEPFVRTPA